MPGKEIAAHFIDIENDPVFNQKEAVGFVHDIKEKGTAGPFEKFFFTEKPGNNFIITQKQ